MIADVNTRSGQLNCGVLSLMCGYPEHEIWAWAGVIPEDAHRAVRHRQREAEAAMGRKLSVLEILVYYAVRENATLRVNGETVVNVGVRVTRRAA